MLRKLYILLDLPDQDMLLHQGDGHIDQLHDSTFSPRAVSHEILILQCTFFFFVKLHLFNNYDKPCLKDIILERAAVVF